MHGTTLPAGPYFRVEAGTATAPVSLTIFNQNLTAHFWFEQSTTTGGVKVVTIGFDHTSLTIGTTDFVPHGAGAGVQITGASGALEILPGGVAGQISGSPLVQLPGFTVSAATLNVEFNTTSSAVNDTLHYTGALGPATQPLTLDAGPYVRVEADGLTITLAGNSVSGDFFFSYATSLPTGAAAGTTPTTTIEVGAAHLAYNGSSNGGPISDARGAFVVLQKADHTYGFAGVALGTLSGSVGSASLGLEVNTTGQNVDQVVTVNGTAIPIKIDAGTTFAVVVQDVNLNLGNLVEIKGNFVLSSSAFSGTGLTLFVGSGPYDNADGSPNPNAIGLVVNQASLNFHLAGTDKSAGLYALSATGSVALVGLDGLNLTFTSVTFKINTTGQRLSPTDGTSTAADAIDPYTFSLVVTGVHLKVGSVLDISGNLAVTRDATGVLTLTIAGAAMTITVGSTQVLSIGGNASFTIDPATGFHLVSFNIGTFSLFGAPGIDAGAATASALFPTASASLPFAGSTIADDTLGTTTRFDHIDVAYSAGVDPSTSQTQKFSILINGAVVPGLVVSTVPTRVAGQVNTWRYTVTGFPTNQTGIVAVQFLPGAFSSGGVQDVGSVQTFSLVAHTGDQAGPVAALANPAPGQPVTASALNTAGYIDVSYRSMDGAPINKSTLTTLAPFTLTGPGVAGVLLNPDNTPVLVGTPLLIGGTSASATSVTYRYFLQKSSGATGGLFGNGQVTVTFLNGKFATTDGIKNGDPRAVIGTPGQTQTFTLSDSAPGGGTTSRTLSLGPVSLQGPTISIADVGFKDGELVLTIAFGADHAGLNFGSNSSSGASSTSGAQSSSGVAINLTGIAGTFDVKFDALGLLSGNFRFPSLTGKFSLNIAQLTATVPGVVVLTASGIQIGYDPAGPADQTLVSINSASISFPAFNLTGTIRPYDPNAGHSVSATSSAPGLIPGLVIRENGFTLGQAELDYGVATPTGDPLSNGGSSTNAVSLGSILTFKDIRVGVQNFSVNFSAENPVVFNGSIYFASGGATFLPGKPVSATITALPGPATPTGRPTPRRCG